MKYCLIFLIVILAATVQANSLRLTYGYGSGSNEGYMLDTGLIVKSYNGSYDTIWGPTDSVYLIDTTVTLTGPGYLLYELIGVYNGYPGEGYSIKKWEAYIPSGYGQFACTLLAVDTSTAPDSARADVGFDIKTASGESWAMPRIGAGQTQVVISLDSGTYTWSASSHRQVWGSKTLTVTAAKTDTIFGYSTYSFASLTAPADSNFCVVYGIVRELGSGTAIKNAKVTITPPKVNKNTCDSTYFAMPEVIDLQTGPWHGYADGYFADTLLKCNCMEDTALVYKIRISKGVSVIQEFEFNIPRDSGTYLLTPFSGD